MPLLTLLFLLTAVLYSSVGLGGGSTYNALLVLADTDYRVLPSIALVCNLIVVSGGVWQYRRSGDLSLGFALPFVALSLPMAWFGGSVPIQRDTFILLLGLSLLAAGLTMWFQTPETKATRAGSKSVRWLIGLPLGGAVGFLSGMVGIGGGIFLAPLLHLLRLAPPKRIAATASFFIMVNSLAGLAGQASKQGSVAHLERLLDYVWLAGAVLIGGQVGSRLGTQALSGHTVKRLTAVLVLYVAARLLYMSFA
ncbi:MAG: sulfite exporter TauE/SafE family protein [Polyangiales bacterium]